MVLLIYEVRYEMCVFIYIFEREGQRVGSCMEKCGSWQGQKWECRRVAVDDFVNQWVCFVFVAHDFSATLVTSSLPYI